MWPQLGSRRELNWNDKIFIHDSISEHYHIDKVWICWEGHKIWKNLPHKIWHYSVTSNFKWEIFSNIVAFSEYLNFLKTYLFLSDYLLTLNGLWIQGGHHKICQHLFGREVSKMRTQISKKSGEPVWEGSIILYEVIYGCPPPPISSNFLVVGTHLPSQLWNAQDFRRSQQIQHALQLLRGVILGGAGGVMAPPDFGRLVNLISTRGTNYAHLITTGRPFRPSDGPGYDS